MPEADSDKKDVCIEVKCQGLLNELSDTFVPVYKYCTD